MTGTVATPFSAAFSPSPPRGMMRSTTPSWVASSASSSRPPPATSTIAPAGTPASAAASRGDRGQHRVGVRRRRRAAQHDRVARLQAQRGGVDRDVRPRLVDDGDDAERHAHLAHVEAVGQPLAVDDLADRVGQRGDVAHAVGDRRDAPRVERAAGRAARRRARSRGRPPCRARWPRGSPACAPRARRRSRAAPRPWSPRRQRGERRATRRGRRGRARRPSARRRWRARPVRGGGGHRPITPGRSSRGARPRPSPAAAPRAPGALFMPMTWRSSVGRVVGDALADDRRALGHVDRVAGVEAAADVDDPDRQQRRAALAQRAGGAGVDDDRAVRGLGVAQPELERRVARLLGREARARRPRRPAPCPARRRRRPLQIDGRDARPRSPSRPRRPSSACRPSPAATSRGRSRGAPSASKSSTSPTSSRRRVGARIGGVEARRCRSAGRAGRRR